MAVPENKLLIPKWKKRTEETHQIHQRTYIGGTYDYVFIGDSMVERWATTGKDYLAKMRNEHSIALLGVGGDGIENLLYRLEDERTILNKITIRKAIYLMIGTNNLQRSSAKHIFEGIKKVIATVKKSCDVDIKVLPLPVRFDVDKAKNDDLNLKLLPYVEDHVTVLSMFDNSNDKKFYDDHVHFNEEGYKLWYEELCDSFNHVA